MNVDIPRVIKALQESEADPRAAVRSLTTEAEEREAEAEALRQVAGAINLLTNGEPPVRVAQPTPTSPIESGETPRGMEAIRRVMFEGGVYNGRSMLAELTKRGWEPRDAKHPLAAVEAAMDRLFRVKKEIDRVGRGEYTMKGHPASPRLEMLDQM